MLVEIIDGKLLQTKAGQSNQPEARALFKMSDKLLIEFSKQPEAW